MSREIPTTVDCVCGFGNQIPEDQTNCPTCGLDIRPLHRIKALKTLLEPTGKGRSGLWRVLVPVGTFLLGLCVLPLMQRIGTQVKPALTDYSLVGEGVAKHIKAHRALTTAAVQVTADARGVHLRGSVPSLLHAQLAAEIANGVPGALGHVSNELQVSLSPSEAYRVQSGDSYASIARKFYGSEKYWPKVYQANKDQLARPGWLHVGQQLTIPREP